MKHYCQTFILILSLTFTPIVSFANENENTVSEQVIASSFGFDPNDSTDALQKAIDSGAKIVVVDKQDSPWIVRPLTLRSDLELVLQEGVEIIAKQGEFKPLGDCLMRAVNASNLIVRGEGKGACLRMRKKEYWKEPYRLSEWRHGLSLLSSSHVLVENLTIAETGGDGIYVGVQSDNIPCRDITIKNVVCAENNRQGISVISVDGLLIEDCVLRDTVGTPPAAGIDFEPNFPNEQITNVVMRRVLAIDNDGCGFAFYLPQMEENGKELTFTIDSCQAVRNASSGISLQLGNSEKKVLSGRMEFKDCQVIGNNMGIAVVGKPYSGAELLFKNIKILTAPYCQKFGLDQYTDYNFTVVSDEKFSKWINSINSRIRMLCNSLDTIPNGGVTFDNVEVNDFVTSNSETNTIGLKNALYLSDSSGDTVSFKDISGNISFIGYDDAGTTERKDWSINDEMLYQNIPEIMPSRVKITDFSVLNNKELSEEISTAWREKVNESGNSKNGFRLRYFGTYYFYAEKDEIIEMSFQLRQIGRYELKPASISVETPSGQKEVIGETSLESKPDSFSYQVKESGWNKINVEIPSGSLELLSANIPILTSASSAINVIGTTGTFEFYVPKETPDLGIRINAGDLSERITASIFDPNGTCVARFENVETTAIWNMDVDKETGKPIVPTPGFWSLKLERPTVGVLEDNSFRILGVPALLR